MRFILWVFLVLVSLPVFAQSQTVRVATSQVSLISSHKIIENNKPFKLGILIQLDENWDTYWKNGGDTGFPAKIKWTLPENTKIGETPWPAPHTTNTADIINYVHLNELLLTYETTITGVKKGTRIPIIADVNWLMCKDVCIPAKAKIETELLVGEKEMLDASLQPLFLRSERKIPKQFWAKVDVIKVNNNYNLKFPISSFEKAVFIPDAEGMIIDSANQNLKIENRIAEMSLKIDEYGDKIDNLSGLLRLTKNGKNTNYSFSSPIKVTASPSNSNIQKSIKENFKPELSFIMAIAFAFIAGLILNLMPCVLPVLFIKIMGLVNHAQGKYTNHHLLSFLAGVLIPFWVLGGLLIIFKQSGEALGWGFHLQSPIFIGFLVIVMLLIALNLFGVFEFGTSFSKISSKLKRTNGHIGVFFSGILMTLVATPCTVPFMGGAMAYGLSQSAEVTLAIFTSLGVGMAFPYMFLAVSPWALKFIPKPGGWMITFRKILGIPMLLTGLWLLWIYSQQVTVGSLNSFSFALLAVVFASLLFGKFNNLSAGLLQKLIANAVMLIAIIVAGYFAVDSNNHKKAFVDDVWQEWSEEKLQAELLNKRTVFIDFTADWCITCKYVETTVLNKAKTLELFKKHNVLLLKADWTTPKPSITKALKRYGREGVPLYILHKNGNKQGLILPQMLTFDDIKEQL